MKKTEIYTYIAILILIIFASILIFKVHHKFEYYRTLTDTCPTCAKIPINYPYPIHSDEWGQLSAAKYMINNNALEGINPYTNAKKINFEPGFTSFLAQFFILTGLDPVYNYQYLPAISIIIILLSLILFCYAWTNSYWAGILSSIFLLSIQNTINIMGLWFFIPLTFSLSILFMYAHSILTKKYYLTTIFFCLSILVYPLLTIILVLLTIPFGWKILKQKNKKHIGIISALFLTAIIGMLIYFKFNIWQITNGLIFRYGWTTGFERIYNPLIHFAILGFIFGIIGIYFVFRKHLEKHLLIPLSFCIGLVLMWTIFKISILLPYQRAYLYMLIFTAIFSGIGLYYVLKILTYILDKLIKNNILATITKILIIAIILISTIAIQYNNYYKTKDATFWPQFFVSEKDITALKWIEHNTKSDTIMMVPQQVVFASYAVSHRKVVAVLPSTFESGDWQIVYNFYNSRNCGAQRELLKKTNADIAYFYYQIPCGFKELYNKDGIYIYETNQYMN